MPAVLLTIDHDLVAKMLNLAAEIDRSFYTAISARLSSTLTHSDKNRLNAHKKCMNAIVLTIRARMMQRRDFCQEPAIPKTGRLMTPGTGSSSSRKRTPPPLTTTTKQERKNETINIYGRFTVFSGVSISTFSPGKDFSISMENMLT